MPDHTALVANADDAEQVKAGRRKLESRQQRTENAMRAVVATREGRVVVNALLDHCGAFETLAPVVDSHAQMAFYAGKKDVGHYVLAQVGQAAPEALALMAKEAREDRNA
jgi:hypothetical protein